MRADLQRAASGMPVAASPPTRLDMYPQTQRMGTGTMMAGATSQIPPVDDYEYANRGDYGQDGRGGGHSRRWIPWVIGVVLVIAVVCGVAYYLLAGGGKTYAVPLVNNEPVATAQAQIRSAHLSSTVVQKTSDNVKKGYVINSTPAEGNNVASGTVVTLYVSSGAAAVPVPNVVGQSQSEATSNLAAKGFNVSVKTDSTSTQAAGTVLSQSPSASSTEQPGSTVTITVSGGAVQIPQVVGSSAQTAQSILTQDGFQVTVTQGSGPSQYANGTVFQQVPSSGTTAAKGSQVTIYVQNGASTPTPPTTPTPTDTASGGPLGF
jgi:serine/threonine-protein kinase